MKLKKLYDLVVDNVVKRLMRSVTSFKSLVSKFGDIVEDLTAAVKRLPRAVLNLRRVGQRLYKAVGKFIELPPVVKQVKDLTTTVTALFKDIKTDVMQLYNVSNCR